MGWYKHPRFAHRKLLQKQLQVATVTCIWRLKVCSKNVDRPLTNTPFWGLKIWSVIVATVNYVCHLKRCWKNIQWQHFPVLLKQINQKGFHLAETLLTEMFVFVCNVLFLFLFSAPSVKQQPSGL